MTDRIAQKLSAIPGVEVIRPDQAATGVTLDTLVPAESVRAFASAVRSEEFLVESVTALDAKSKMMVLYHFTRVDAPVRLCGRVLIDREAPECPTISDIYPGANWHERETHDFYGIVFAGHPDLSPLILPEESAGLMPLRKSEKNLKELGEVIPRFAPPAPAAEEKAEVKE